MANNVWPHWRKLNHQIIRQRLEQLESELRKKFASLLDAFTHNVNERLEALRELGDELLEGAYIIYGQIATESGYPKSAAFAQTVYINGLRPLIRGIHRAMEKVCFQVAGGPPESKRSAELMILLDIAAMFTNGLADKWKEKTWKEANELEYRSHVVEKSDGRLALGKTIDTLYDEFKRLKQFARGRRKTEATLRQQFPGFQLWEEIDTSSSLPSIERGRFFEKTWSSHGRKEMMTFIGLIVEYEEPTVYKIWKEYRDHTGKKRKRRSRSTERPKPKSKRKP